METVEKAPKKYLYHLVPHDLKGTTLHPLNRLKDIHPDLYVSKANKYSGREHIMENFIPTLECKWNDVLQFSPIHPEELKQAMIEAGVEPREMRFFQVDPDLLDPEKTTVYLYNNTDVNHIASNKDYTNYAVHDVPNYSTVRELTKQFWKDSILSGNKRPLIFVGVPHILHKGSIDVSELPVITV